MFIFAISCLTTYYLPWFMDLTFQVPVQYCSLQHQTLLSPPDISIAGFRFLFDSASSFLLELFLDSFPVAYWKFIWPGKFIFQCHIFLPFHIVHGVLKARMLKWFAISLSSGPWFVRPFHHDPSIWVTLHGMTDSFTELEKAVARVIILVSFLWLWFSFCLPSDGWV